MSKVTVVEIHFFSYLLVMQFLVQEFFQTLKYAIVQPSFKNGNKQDIFIYRPISLLASFSEIIEKLIYIRLYAHIDKNNILVNE
jgi:hypothetical protein